ncbi:MAG: DUF4258 domain-containing protein [Dehalococcoidia bacterium]
MKPIRFSGHANEQMIERGASEAEVIGAIRDGERAPAKQGRQGFRRNYPYGSMWGGRVYAIKQVFAIVAEEPDVLVVVTVYTYYF